MNQQSSFGVAVVAGLAITAAAAWWKHRQNLPKKWRQVGQLNDLWYYPIKSCSPIELNTANCTVLGLEQNGLTDRTFMITGDDFVSKNVRMFPHMTLIKCKFEGNTLTLEAPEMEVLTIQFDITRESVKTDIKKGTIYGQNIDVIDCGNKVAAWLSKYIMKKGSGCRLIYYPKKTSTRQVEPEYTVFTKLKPSDKGALGDVSSFMLINQVSINDLKSRLDASVSCTTLHFRPNFVVNGGELQPYEEDYWEYVRIGDEAVFQCVMPCLRCFYTIIDPLTGKPNADREPLKTLKTYRQIRDPKLRPSTKDSPVMGVQLVLCKPGRVKHGDHIFVSC